jgi:hypothetical protein
LLQGRQACIYVWRTKNRAIPVRHEKIVSIVKTVRACLYRIISSQVAPGNVDAAHTSTETFLALLQLLEQAKVSWNFGTHCCDGVVKSGSSVTRGKVGYRGPRYLCAAMTVNVDPVSLWFAVGVIVTGQKF